uniref:Uncharacterized protein n=1 Tax=Ditylenchus dipsaci TaxID=166011 RepID=A0A915DRF0_9BILA
MDMDQLKQILEAQTNQHALALQQQQQQHQESLAQLVYSFEMQTENPSNKRARLSHQERSMWSHRWC